MTYRIKPLEFKPSGTDEWWANGLCGKCFILPNDYGGYYIEYGTMQNNRNTLEMALDCANEYHEQQLMKWLTKTVTLFIYVDFKAFFIKQTPIYTLCSNSLCSSVFKLNRRTSWI